MANVADILTRIDEGAPLKMDIEASVRDYCILAIKFLKGQESPARYFEGTLPNPMPVLDGEAAARRCAGERYCRQLYRPDSNPLLADAIADLAFAQSERLTLAEPENPQADDRERAMVYIVAVYTLFALSLHGRTDFAALFLEAWANFNALASARVIRRRYDKSWHSRYNSLFYPLG